MLWGTSTVSEYQFSYILLITEAFRSGHLRAIWASVLRSPSGRAHLDR